jgi:hypothetical protein
VCAQTATERTNNTTAVRFITRVEVTRELVDDGVAGSLGRNREDG